MTDIEGCLRADDEGTEPETEGKGGIGVGEIDVSAVGIVEPRKGVELVDREPRYGCLR